MSSVGENVGKQLRLFLHIAEQWLLQRFGRVIGQHLANHLVGICWACTVEKAPF